MSSTPTDLLVLNGPQERVFLGYSGTPGLADLDPLLRNNATTTTDVMRSLSWVQSDPVQHAKLRDFMVRQSASQALSSADYTVSYDGHGARTGDPVLAQLRHHLHTGRIRALKLRRHARIEHARPMVASVASVAAAPAPPAGATPPAPASAHAWSAAERVEALLRDSLPFLGRDLRDELNSLLSAKGLAETVGVMAALAAVQAIPVVGEAMDAALMGIVFYYAGISGLRALARLVALVRSALKAHSAAEIQALAPDTAKAIETLGIACLLALGARWKGRSPEMGGGVPAGAATPAEAAPAAAEEMAAVPRPMAAKPAAPAAGEAGAAAETAAAGENTAAGGVAGQSAGEAAVVGDPVNAANGAVYVEHTDFVLPGPLPLSFARLWTSTSTVNGDLGHGWHHSLDMALLPRPDGTLALRLADGRFVVMPEPAPGRPSHDAVERMQLCLRDAEVAAVDHAGRSFRFGPAVGPQRMRRLVEIADPNGNAVRLERDRFGGLVSITDGAGRVLGVRRDELGRILAIDAPHPDGPGAGDGRLVLVSFGYDRNGDLSESRDANGATFRHGYERHLLVRTDRPAGLSFHWRYNDTALRRRARCVHTWGDGGLYERFLSYDDAARRTTVRSGRGGIERYECNEQGRVVAVTDALGRRRTSSYAPDGKLLLAEARADGSTRSRRHDAYGRLVESVDYDGAVTRISYAGPDAEGLVTALPSRIEAPDGAETSFEWDARGNLAAHTDPLGRVRRFLRDTRGLTLAVRDALGVLRRFGWGEDGLLAWEAAGEDGARIRYGYDALGRLSERQAGGDWPTRYRSDAAGRLVEVRRGDGGVVRIGHDAEGNITRHVSAVGNETQWRYDGLPFPVERRDADGTRLRYRYDADLNLVELTNQKDERYALAFDLADRLVSETGFDGRHRTYQYDAAGFLARHTDAEERGATYRRDPLGRLLERWHSDGLCDRYGFDTVGRMVLAANDWGEVGFAYARDGALIEERSPAGAIRHGYDARGRRTSTTLPDGRVIETGWDNRDGVESVSFDGRRVATFERDALGRETGRQAGALHTETAYDPQGRLVRQTGRAGAAARPVIDRQYAWDGADRLTELVDLERGVRRYLYDPRSRLVGVDGDLPERFTFDPASNIVASSSDDGAGAPGLAVGDRLLMRGDRKFEYDGCGNRVREVRGCGGKVERLYRYNADNQLREVEERSRLGRRVTSFTYDALGRRTSKNTSFSSGDNPNGQNPGSAPSEKICTTFTWDANTLFAEKGIGEAYGATSIIHLYEPATLRPLAQVRVRNDVYEPNICLNYQLDHIGTPQRLTAEDGRVVWSEDHLARGKNARRKRSEISQPFGFVGQYKDRETGLAYNRFRYYAPDEGIYIQQDPVRLKGGVNLSKYASDPTSRVDPFGLCPVEKALSPAEEARSWQGSGDYPGVDDYENVVIPKGTKLVGAVPGQSQYYTSMDEFSGMGGTAEEYYNNLQIKPADSSSGFPPYRPGVTVYEVTEDTPAAFGHALANPQISAGGAGQYYVPGYKNNLTPLYSIPFAK